MPGSAALPSPSFTTATINPDSDVSKRPLGSTLNVSKKSPFVARAAPLPGLWEDSAAPLPLMAMPMADLLKRAAPLPRDAEQARRRASHQGAKQFPHHG